ncbi:hypothetical protein HNP32_003484 [Brevundimonas bullata]|uniref:Uncharacterized protein n=1 Tax=Brevundimonas bullata TaxID=13160 RepID=A0A7W7ISH6_9CAUL|nr:hypothetical protein [Brevundimonas bullata]MBB4799724.1 hypothetical protein [Brevundimonas bullata]MBB6384654.1 hypothetical protein [Brevundimonas bullata]
MNTATKAAAANKKKMDDLTVGLCALVVVSSGLTVATPFWPAQLGNAPQLGVVLLAAAVAVFSAIHSLHWWRALDEAAKEAHKWAWWWGGNLGLVVGGAGVVAATLMGLDVNLLPAFVQRSDAALVATGVLGVFAAQAVGYGLAWCGWWMARR